MGNRTGFTKALPKSYRKQKRGSDQEFTLQKGVSAAPIKQATKYKPKMKLSSGEKGFLLGTTVTGAVQSGLEKIKNKKPKIKKPVGGSGIRRFNRDR
jgi:hypothetical protein